MIFKERSLTFREFAIGETVPLSLVQETVLAFLRDRDDVAVFGAQAVNAYVDEPRMSQDVDILAVDAASIAETIRQHLNEQFHIAVRIRTVGNGLAFRIYQVREPRNRHLVYIRQVVRLPPCQRMERILVPTPPEPIGQKILSMVARSRTAKGMTDVADIRRLLLAFPDLKSEAGAVADTLHVAGASSEVMATWREIVAEDIEAEDDEY